MAGVEPTPRVSKTRRLPQSFTLINMAKLFKFYPAALPTELPSRNIITNIIIILAGREGWIRTTDIQVLWKIYRSKYWLYVIYFSWSGRQDLNLQGSYTHDPKSCPLPNYGLRPDLWCRLKVSNLSTPGFNRYLIRLRLKRHLYKY